MQTNINLQGLTGAGGKDDEQKMKQEQERKSEKDRMVKSLIDEKAADRLSNLRLVKPQVADMVCETILQQAKMGMLGNGRVDDATFKAILDKINQASGNSSCQAKTKVVRKKNQWSDDEIIDSDDE